MITPMSFFAYTENFYQKTFFKIRMTTAAHTYTLRHIDIEALGTT